MFDPMEFEIDEPEKVVYVVGIGPGDVYYLTQEAQNVLEHADAICGYKLYLDLIEPEFPCEEYYSTGMTKEIDRCRWALEKADTGRRVVMVCSGDAGVYGMASPQRRGCAGRAAGPRFLRDLPFRPAYPVGGHRKAAGLRSAGRFLCCTL